MKRNSYFAVGALALGLVIGATLMRPNSPSPVMPAAQAVAEGPSLRREALEGQDVAKLLQLDAYKWRYLLPASPKGRDLNAVVWIEDWRRGGAQPKVYWMGSMSVMKSRGVLMLKMPRTAGDDYVVSIDGGQGSGKAVGFLPLSGLSSGGPDHQPIALERDIILVYKAKNQSGSYSGTPQSDPNYARKNDRTVYVKVRFTKKTDNLEAIWKNGRIELN